MNIRKKIAIAVSAALLVVVVAVSVSFASHGVELWSDTAAFTELAPARRRHFPVLSVLQTPSMRCSMYLATAAPV